MNWSLTLSIAAGIVLGGVALKFLPHLGIILKTAFGTAVVAALAVGAYRSWSSIWPLAVAVVATLVFWIGAVIATFYGEKFNDWRDARIARKAAFKASVEHHHG